MSSNLDRYKVDLDRLLKLGETMSLDLSLRVVEAEGDLSEELKQAKRTVGGNFEKNFQGWYTEARAVVRQIVPERLQEFDELYLGNSKRKEISSVTFTIQDWLLGVRAAEDHLGKKYFRDIEIASMKFQMQLEILCSANSRFETSLFDIEQILQADLFDSELDAARELLKNGFLRGAGAIAGVVLERHLGQVSKKHDIVTRKKHPSISDWNALLKEGGVVDVPTWRFIQRLGDLRNLCDHNKDRDPSKSEVEELIAGSEKIVKTLL